MSPLLLLTSWFSKVFMELCSLCLDRLVLWSKVVYTSSLGWSRQVLPKSASVMLFGTEMTVWHQGQEARLSETEDGWFAVMHMSPQETEKGCFCCVFQQWWPINQGLNPNIDTGQLWGNQSQKVIQVTLHLPEVWTPSTVSLSLASLESVNLDLTPF
jgi:hypothetical protein